ncbi:MAG: CopG family transcriptional regulator [Candidatus Bipolaricaulota bacterium]|nr:MAG: CopG family transcriptional regulator [Candidatus Bipolaricaulota bacterium]
MPDTEKITINLGPVDLGRIDVLVDQGLYSNRTDLIRTAIRNLLDRHEPVIEGVARKWSFVVGAQELTRQELEELREEGKMLVTRVMGTVSIDDSVDPGLARATIKSIRIFGALRASPEVRAAIKDRINPKSS